MKRVINILVALVMTGDEMKCSAQTVSGQVEGHDYVDLGLPSGIKWATCNVGATKPTEFGDYFAWGETKPKENYHWSTYKWCIYNPTILAKPSGITKYNTVSNWGTIDNRTTLEVEDDAATENWGSAWRMPTMDEIKQLRENCDWRWVKDFQGSGVNGHLGTSKNNGATIFLPAAGHHHCRIIYGDGRFGSYWSSSLCEAYSDFACCFSPPDGVVYDYRYFGRCVRAVIK